MRKNRSTEEQWVEMLREVDRIRTPALARKHGVCEQTLYTWRKRLGELDPTGVKRLVDTPASAEALERRIR